MTSHSQTTGTLYIVATPIGNLEDISARAIRILREVDLIAAEDTRHSAQLLSHFAINTPTISCHEHNQAQRSPLIIQQLLKGDSVALISDAGTPLISDPGFALVRSAREQGIPVSPLPGASAAIAALSVSGLPVDRFLFAGFLPSTAAQRRKELEGLTMYPVTLVFFESPHRVVACLEDMARVLGGARKVMVCRELTKKFETFLSGDLDELSQRFTNGDEVVKGEFVLVVEPGVEEDHLNPVWIRTVNELREHLPLKKAAQLVSGLTGARSQALYAAAMTQNG